MAVIEKHVLDGVNSITFIIFVVERVVTIHCLATLNLGAGFEQPIDFRNIHMIGLMKHKHICVLLSSQVLVQSANHV